MNFEVDFYEELRRLIYQIPNGSVSTVYDLAEALGDKSSKNAILEILNKKDFEIFKNKVVTIFNSEEKLFKNFSSRKLLFILREFQKNQSKRIIESDKFDKFELIAGVDVSYKDDKAYAACVVLNMDLRIIDMSFTTYKTRFPYIPGYLSFREGPPIREVVKRVSGFDILMVNGHGVAHPRFFGLASHVGLELDIPTIGVTEKRLVGKIISKNDSWDAILYKGRVVGAKLNVKGKKNIYVSVGHKISLDTSIKIVRNFCTGFELPEPLRIAHILSKNLLKS